MLLAPPNIYEPISVCSRRVRLTGQSQNAVVLLRGAGDRPLGKWTATWPDELFDLDAGVTLQAGEPVSVMQTHDADASGWSSIPIVVQDSGPSNPLIVLPVTSCSREVQATGIAPGAVVTVVDKQNGSTLGSSQGGTVEVISLSRTLITSDHIELSATSCGGAGGPTSAEPKIETLRTVDPRERRLMQVTVEQPVRACQRLLVVRDGQPGTNFVLERADGSQTSWPLHADGGKLRVAPLDKSEALTWWVEPGDPHCEVQRSERDGATTSSDPPGAPTISTEPCPGTRVLHVGGLVPSATVHLRVDGVDVLETIAGGADQDIDLAGVFLVAGQRLTVAQRLCDDWSDASPPVAVTVASTREPVIVEPLFPCASVVVVHDVSPGATVVVLSERLGPGEIGRVVANSSSVSVPISPYLEELDAIIVRVIGCHPAELKAAVAGQTDVPPPILQQAYVGTHALVVADVIPGSTIDVVISGHHVAGATATDEWVDIELEDALIPGDQIELIVRLCSIQRRTDPQSPTAPPTPGYGLIQAGGIDCGGGNWAAGQVEHALGTPGDVIVAGCREAGVWISHPDGSAEPVSYSWAGAQVLGLAADPGNPLHIFAATVGGLRETDPASADPLHTWRDVPLPAPASGHLYAVAVTDDRIVVVADDKGVWWSSIPAAGGAWDFQTDPLVARACSGLAPVNDGIVAAASQRIAIPGQVTALPPAMFRGESIGGAVLTWSETTNTAPAQFLIRMGRTVIASSSSDRNRVYALSADVANDQLLGVLSSQDAGRSWICPHLGIDPSLDRFQVGKPWDMRLQAPRDMGIAVHPTDPSRVIISGRRERLLGSTDGCATFDSDGYPDILNSSFHADSRLITYDTSMGTPRLLVGNDGGLYVSLDETGHSFNSSRNRGFSTLMIADTPSPSMASAPDVPGSCSVGLQDNGEAWTIGGKPWHQSVGGDGERQLVVLGRYLFHSDNDAPPLQWSEFTAGGLGSNHEVKRPTIGPKPMFESFVSPVNAPSWANADGHYLVAYAAELAGAAPVIPGDLAQTPSLYGIFYDPGAGDDRFFGTLLATLPGTPTGVASYDGQVAVVCILDPSNKPHLYRYDAAAGTLLESKLPPGINNVVQIPELSGPRSGVAVSAGHLLVSDDLQTWTVSPADSSVSGITAVAIDTTEHPAAVHVGTDTVVVVVRDRGRLISKTGGLPKDARVTQLNLVTDSTGTRWLYLGSWAWSVWRAKLS